MNYARPIERRSQDSAWPLRRADGTRWNEEPRPGYNPLTTEAHTPELRECPFCRGEAEYHTDNGPTGEIYGWVGCNRCDAMSCHIDVRSMQPEETHPIDAWNTRPDDALRAVLVEALEAIEKLTAPGQEMSLSDAIDAMCDCWTTARAALAKAKAGAA